MVAIVKLKWSEHTKSVNAFSYKANFITNFLFEIFLYGVLYVHLVLSKQISLCVV